MKASKDGEVKQFFTMVEYEKWKKNTKQGAGWKIKYYKGLGTSTAAEAKDYFGKIYDHRIDFRRVHGVVVLHVFLQNNHTVECTHQHSNVKEFASALPDCNRWKGTGDNKLIDMAFNKGRADDRKTWMNKYQALWL